MSSMPRISCLCRALLLIEDSGSRSYVGTGLCVWLRGNASLGEVWKMRTWSPVESGYRVLWTQFLHDYPLHSLMGYWNFPWQIQEHFLSIPIPQCHLTWEGNTYLSYPGSNCLSALPGVTPSGHCKMKPWSSLSSFQRRTPTRFPVTWSFEARGV